jgi:hypothetical protein
MAVKTVDILVTNRLAAHSPSSSEAQYKILTIVACLSGKIEDDIVSDDEMTADDFQDEERAWYDEGAISEATRNTKETVEQAV